jgi:hypothetical protein
LSKTIKKKTIPEILSRVMSVQEMAKSFTLSVIINKYPGFILNQSVTKNTKRQNKNKNNPSTYQAPTKKKINKIKKNQNEDYCCNLYKNPENQTQIQNKKPKISFFFTMAYMSKNGHKEVQERNKRNPVKGSHRIVL